ncbi:MAG: VWA domain-containing protein [Roseivivax sp.]|nr:VWA domain-containing protein [Roseivivax sp.]
MVVFDGSGSMAEMGFNRLDLPRIVEARHAVRMVAPRVAPLRRLGLIVYGPGMGDSCSNIDLRFAPLANAAGRMISEIDGLEPTGETPLTDAVARAAKVLGGAGTVVLVTDGQETCGGAPCQLAAELAAEGQVTVHVIGFKLRGQHFAFPGGDGEQDYQTGTTVARCLADRTGGSYVSAETVQDLIGALQETLGCPLYSALR